MDSNIVRMHEIFERQRRAFAAQPYPELAQRKARLNALKQVLRRYQNVIVDAVSADFGCRSGPETRLVEILGPVLEANHAIASMRRWAKPSRRHAELLFLINRVWVSYQPKGVVGVITPWNFPLYLSLGPLIAAIAAGNRVMIKMSEFSPNSTEVLARMVAECFAEDEVAVFGGEVEAAVAFSKMPFDHLVFTGSPVVGKHVMRAAADNLTPVTLELGGKSPVLLSPKGSVEQAATRVAHGKAFNSGQICLAPDYALVPRERVDAFAAAAQAAFRRFYPKVQGNHEYTSLATPARAQRIRDLLADAEAKGGRIAVCGDVGDGAQIPLHVVTGVRDDMRIAGEELFGPILPVIGYDSLDEAIAYINARPRPLGMYPFGFDAAGIERLLRVTHSGGMSCDDWGWHAFNHDLPFGGIGNSGMGSYHGVEGFRALSHARAVFRKHRWYPISLFYPPYGNWVQRALFKFYLGEADPTLQAGPSDRVSKAPH